MKLQLALDTQTISQCLDILARVSDDIDIIEIGTPLIIREGLAAVRAIRKAYPDKLILADLKIADAGAHEAQLGFSAGADIVTVLAAVDGLTILEAIQTAHRTGNQVLVDLIGLEITAELIMRLESLSPDLICVHNAVDLQAQGRQATGDLAVTRPLVRSAALAVAGGINPKNILEIVSLKPDVIIVGSGITSAPDPAVAARQIRKAMDQFEQRTLSQVSGSSPKGTVSVHLPETRSDWITVHIADEILTDIGKNLHKVAWSDFERFVQAITSSSRLFLAGAGRSGLVARAFAMRLMHVGKSVYAVGEVVTPAIGMGDRLVIVSGSGETSGLVQIAQKALTSGAVLSLITIQPESTLGRMADQVLKVPGAVHMVTQTSTDATTGILPMGSLFELSVAILFETVIIQLMAYLQVDEKSMFERHANLE